MLLLQDGPQTMVGIATFDCTIHFYNLRRASQQVYSKYHFGRQAFWSMHRIVIQLRIKNNHFFELILPHRTWKQPTSTGIEVAYCTFFVYSFSSEDVIRMNCGKDFAISMMTKIIQDERNIATLTQWLIWGHEVKLNMEGGIELIPTIATTSFIILSMTICRCTRLGSLV